MEALKGGDKIKYHVPRCLSKGCKKPEGQLILNVQNRESAVVVSVKYHTRGNQENFSEHLKEKMEMLAEQIERMGGMVGHIKASVESRQVEMFSLTEYKADRKTAESVKLVLILNVIVFAIEDQVVERMVRKMLEELNEKERKHLC